MIIITIIIIIIIIMIFIIVNFYQKHNFELTSCEGRSCSLLARYA